MPIYSKVRSSTESTHPSSKTKKWMISILQHCFASLFLCLITDRKRSLGQGNIFRSVCQEFCPQRGSTRAGTPSSWAGIPPWQVYPLGRYTPRAGTPLVGTPPRQYTPLGRYTLQAGTPPGQIHTPVRYTPSGRYTLRQVRPRGQVHPSPHPMVNARAVRILLECILVMFFFKKILENVSPFVRTLIPLF